MSSNDTVRVPRLLGVRDLVRETGIPRWRWFQLFARGQGPKHIRVGKTFRVSDEALREWLAEREKTNTQETT